MSMTNWDNRPRLSDKAQREMDDLTPDEQIEWLREQVRWLLRRVSELETMMGVEP